MEGDKRNSDTRVAPSNGRLPSEAEHAWEQEEYGRSSLNGISKPSVEGQAPDQGVYTYN